MRNFFPMIARLLAYLFAILFVITSVLAVPLTIINQQIFNADLYKTALVEQKIYTRLPEIVGVALTSGSKYGSGKFSYENGMPDFFKNFTEADWQTTFTILLPAADLQTMAESMLDQMVAYLNGETNTVTVPLNKLKENLMGSAGADLIIQLIGSKPACTSQDLTQMLTGTLNGEIVLVLCKPPEFMLSIEASLLPALLKSIVPQIPDSAIIINPPASGVPRSGAGPFGADPIASLETIRVWIRLSPLIPLIFLLLITLFAVRSPKDWLRWWGIPIFISAAIGIGLGILAEPVLNMAWNLLIIPQIPPYIPAGIATIGQQLLRSIVHSITNGIFLWTIIFLLIGLAAWIGSYYIKTKNEPDVLLPPPTPVP
jgi:hypothetical protein